MTRRPKRTLRTRRHVQCTLPSFLRIVWRRYMRPHNHLRAEKEIPKVGTTCANRHHAPSNPLIGLARHHAKSQKPAPNCSSWARAAATVGCTYPCPSVGFLGARRPGAGPHPDLRQGVGGLIKHQIDMPRDKVLQRGPSAAVGDESELGFGRIK